MSEDDVQRSEDIAALTKKVVKAKIATLMKVVKAWLPEAIENLNFISSYPGGSSSVSHGDGVPNGSAATLTVVRDPSKEGPCLIHLEILIGGHIFLTVAGETSLDSKDSFECEYEQSMRFRTPGYEPTVTDITRVIGYWAAVTNVLREDRRRRELEIASEKSAKIAD